MKNMNKVYPKNGVLDRTNLDDFMDNCEECGKHDELRPYGKNGAWICYDYGMKDVKETEKIWLEYYLEKD